MFRGRIKSFAHAFNGLGIALKEEANLKIHLSSAIIAILLGLLLDIPRDEWVIIILVIGLVISSELLNTAIENLCDRVTTENDAAIKKVKDISAAAVAICSFTALIIGMLIFAPKIWKILV